MAEYNAKSTVFGSKRSTLTDGLVGWWKMNEASWNGTSGEVFDSSYTENNGTRSGNATTTGGKYGRAGTFDGSGDYVNITANSELNISGSSITIASWVSFDVNTRNNFILEKQAGTGKHYYFWYGANTSVCGASANKIVFGYRDETSFKNYCYNWTPTSGTWYHLAATTNGDEVKIYINGINIITLPQIGNLQDSITGDLHLGAESPVSGAELDGRLDEVRLYRRTLTSDEITSIYNYRPGPIAHWKFDETSGTTAYDSTITASNGTLVNMESSDWVDGKLGNAIQFDGTDEFISAGDVLDETFAGSSFSIELWINPTDLTSDQVLVAKHSDANLSEDQRQWNLKIINNRIRFGYVGSLDGVSYRVFETPSNSISSSNWYHIALAYDTSVSADNRPAIYINGKKQQLTINSSAGTPISIPGGLAPLSFGAAVNTTETSSVYNYNGKLDHIKIYSYVRTNEEVVSEYSNSASVQGTTTSKEGLIGYWKMDEASWNGTANEVIDSSGVGNHGYAYDGLTTTSGGKVNRAADLINTGGSKKVIIQDDPSLGLMKELTLSAWVYHSDPILADREIFAKGPHSGGTPFLLWADNASTDHYAFIFTEEAGAETGTQYSSYVPQLNTWEHVALTFKANNVVRMYINGVEDANSPWSIPALDDVEDDGNSLYIGNDSTNTRDFIGKIDEAKMWSRELTREEIFNEYYSALNDITAGTEKSIGGLVAHYELEKITSGTTIKDSVGNDNTGTIHNMDIDSDFIRGVHGNALNFNKNNNEYIDIPDSDNLDFGTTQDFSISAWIRGNGGVGDELTVVAKGDTGGDPRFMMKVNDANNDRILFTVREIDCNGSTDVLDGQWHHLLMSVDRDGSFKGYVDGVQDCSAGTTASENVSSSVPLQIGRSYQTSDRRYFNGDIDDVKIWNKALDHREVNIEYNGGKPIGWWKLDKGEGTTAYDYSGNGNNGTLTNMSPATDWLPSTSCKLNRCLDFDGSNDFINMGNVLNFDGTDPFSFGFWFKTSISSTTPSTIISKEILAPPYTGYYIGFAIDGTSTTQDSLGVAIVDSSTNILRKWTDTAYNDGQWHHGLITYDGNQSVNGIFIYVDGNLQSTSSSGTTISTTIANSSNFEVGARNGTNQPFTGQVDEVRAYRYLLDANDVKIEYNKGSALRYE